ncbi:winged helix-turn-helix domain-containing protein [Microbacterium sp. NPDC055683]
MSKPEGSARAETVSARKLRAMAHPVRLRLEEALGRRGFARAADLAADLDLPANQVSFHLRVLADAGLIEEAPEKARDRRDRVWTRAKQTWELGSPEHPMEDEQAGTAVIRALAAQHQDLVQRIIAWAPEYSSGRAEGVHGTFNQYALWLDEEQFTRMLERIGSVVEEFRDLNEPGAAGARRWRMDLIAADDEI